MMDLLTSVVAVAAVIAVLGLAGVALGAGIMYVGIRGWPRAKLPAATAPVSRYQTGLVDPGPPPPPMPDLPEGTAPPSGVMVIDDPYYEDQIRAEKWARLNAEMDREISGREEVGGRGFLEA